MNFEIIEKQKDVTYEVAKVSFPAYEEYKQKAGEVAEYVRSVVVSPENIKEAKEVLAQSRKLTDRLNRARIDMKKEILRDYMTVEGQIKEITSIVDEADQELRGKVRELDQAERDAKKEQIREIWDARLFNYPDISDMIPDAFYRWLTPKHLNKSTSMKNVEKDMTEWMEQTRKDMRAAEAISKECLAHYITEGNLTEAIESAKLVEAAEKYLEERDKEEGPTVAVASFVVTGKKDIELTERLLTENEINFIKKGI